MEKNCNIKDKLNELEERKIIHNPYAHTLIMNMSKSYKNKEKIFFEVLFIACERILNLNYDIKIFLKYQKYHVLYENHRFFETF